MESNKIDNALKDLKSVEISLPTFKNSYTSEEKSALRQVVLQAFLNWNSQDQLTPTEQAELNHILEAALTND